MPQFQNNFNSQAFQNLLQIQALKGNGVTANGVECAKVAQLNAAAVFYSICTNTENNKVCAKAIILSDNSVIFEKQNGITIDYFGFVDYESIGDFSDTAERLQRALLGELTGNKNTHIFYYLQDGTLISQNYDESNLDLPKFGTAADFDLQYIEKPISQFLADNSSVIAAIQTQTNDLNFYLQKLESINNKISLGAGALSTGQRVTMSDNSNFEPIAQTGDMVAFVPINGNTVVPFGKTYEKIGFIVTIPNITITDLTIIIDIAGSGTGGGGNLATGYYTKTYPAGTLLGNYYFEISAVCRKVRIRATHATLTGTISTHICGK